MKTGWLKKPITSKLAGSERTSNHRVGTHCRLQRHSSDPGLWVLYFGKQYALVNAIDLPDTVDTDPSHHHGRTTSPTDSSR